jgi:large subunit ribosomal protein L21
MFAIFKSGGKQYRVSVGDVLELEKIEAAGKIEFPEVLMVDDKIGTPFVKGAKVVAEILEQKKSAKIIILKYLRRKNSKKKNGHRQPLTSVKIVDIIA